MADLEGRTIAATYRSLLNVGTADNAELHATTLKIIEDGAGNDSPLYLAQQKVKILSATDSTTMFQILDADGGIPIFNVDSTNERVGIGTASPAVELHVEAASGNCQIKIKAAADASNPKLIFADNNGDAWQLIGSDEDDSRKFKVYSVPNTTTRFTIDQDGKVGIGTTSPVNTLHVAHNIADGDNGIMIVNEQTTITDGELLGAIGFDGADGNIPSSCLEASCFIAAYAAEDHGTGDKGGDLTFGCSLINENDDVVSTRHMTILDSGNVGIGTTSPDYNLEIEGSVDERPRISITNTNATGDEDGGELQFLRYDSDGAHLTDDGISLGDFKWVGKDASGTAITGALIRGFIDGADATTDDLPAGLKFMTNAGGLTVTTRLTIDKTGKMTSDIATGTAAGGGIDAVAPTITVGCYNSEIITSIFIDIGAGLILSSSTAGDVIGEDGVANAYLTRITTAKNGLVYRGEIICLEVPTTGDDDVNVCANSSGTIAEDAAGEGQHVLANCGTHTLGLKTDFAIPAGGIVDDYIYLTHGDTTAGTYNAGKFLLKFYGASVSSL